MKKNLFFITILCGGLSFAQTVGKVGIETDSPTETLDVKGTVRVQTLPKNGETVSTPNVGANFNATKTVVVDDNGVLGVAAGTPISKVSKMVPINDQTLINSEIKLGNLAVRFNGTNPYGEEASISLKFLDEKNEMNSENIICSGIKTGSGGGPGAGQDTFFSAQKNTWNEVTNSSLKPNIGNNDFAFYNIVLLNSGELYRLIVSLNRPVNNSNVSGAFVQSSAKVTLFLERLTNHEE